jgi:hypothetical protein
MLPLLRGGAGCCVPLVVPSSDGGGYSCTRSAAGTSATARPTAWKSFKKRTRRRPVAACTAASVITHPLGPKAAANRTAWPFVTGPQTDMLRPSMAAEPPQPRSPPSSAPEAAYAAAAAASTSARNLSTIDSRLGKSHTRYRDCSTGGGKALAGDRGWSEKRTLVPPRSPSKTSAMAATRSAHRMLFDELTTCLRNECVKQTAVDVVEYLLVYREMDFRIYPGRV